MDQEIFHSIEAFMRESMESEDGAHDTDHIYRVLYLALEIAGSESAHAIDYGTLIAACLLHDIGRADQTADRTRDHAQVGSEKAYHWLRENGWQEAAARQIAECILTHRFRSDHPPESIEAKILFDADKLDVTGAIGIARTFLYKAAISEPIYSLQPDGKVSDGSGPHEAPSFLQEYKYKLEKIYDKFYTEHARQIAADRQEAAAAFYQAILCEARTCYRRGPEFLTELLQSENDLFSAENNEE
ncbi:MAG: HD domain-containing protein [Clostridiales bacterium]|jgi:uncharacterized protein|nr:HD domain-containing protein [Clostridiales bacterium]